MVLLAYAGALRAGDAGQIVNQSILSKNNPLGDILFGVDNTFLSRALNAGIFLSYESPALENIDESTLESLINQLSSENQTGVKRKLRKT